MSVNKRSISKHFTFQLMLSVIAIKIIESSAIIENIIKDTNEQCNENEYFNPSTKNCTLFIGGGRVILVDQNKQCVNNSIGVKPYPGNDQFYYVCERAFVILGSCPDGLRFNVKALKCVPNKKLPCDLAQMPKCRESGPFALDRNCSCFYTCNAAGGEFIPTLHQCPGTSLYSPTLNRCSYSCKNPPTEVLNETNIDPNERGCFPPCTKPGQFRTPTDCSKYYQCSAKTNGRFYQTRFKCPDATLYDIRSESCIPRDEVECEMMSIIDILNLYEYYKERRLICKSNYTDNGSVEKCIYRQSNKSRINTVTKERNKCNGNETSTPTPPVNLTTERITVNLSSSQALGTASTTEVNVNIRTTTPEETEMDLLDLSTTFHQRHKPLNKSTPVYNGTDETTTQTTERVSYTTENCEIAAVDQQATKLASTETTTFDRSSTQTTENQTNIPRNASLSSEQFSIESNTLPSENLLIDDLTKKNSINESLNEAEIESFTDNIPEDETTHALEASTKSIENIVPSNNQPGNIDPEISLAERPPLTSDMPLETITAGTFSIDTSTITNYDDAGSSDSELTTNVGLSDTESVLSSNTTETSIENKIKPFDTTKSEPNVSASAISTLESNDLSAANPTEKQLITTTQPVIDIAHSDDAIAKHAIDYISGETVAPFESVETTTEFDVPVVTMTTATRVDAASQTNAHEYVTTETTTQHSNNGTIESATQNFLENNTFESNTKDANFSMDQTSDFDNSTELLISSSLIDPDNSSNDSTEENLTADTETTAKSFESSMVDNTIENTTTEHLMVENVSNTVAPFMESFSLPTTDGSLVVLSESKTSIEIGITTEIGIISTETIEFSSSDFTTPVSKDESSTISTRRFIGTSTQIGANYSSELNYVENETEENLTSDLSGNNDSEITTSSTFIPGMKESEEMTVSTTVAIDSIIGESANLALPLDTPKDPIESDQVNSNTEPDLEPTTPAVEYSSTLTETKNVKPEIAEESITTDSSTRYDMPIQTFPLDSDKLQSESLTTMNSATERITHSSSETINAIVTSTKATTASSIEEDQISTETEMNSIEDNSSNAPPSVETTQANVVAETTANTIINGVAESSESSKQNDPIVTTLLDNITKKPDVLNLMEAQGANELTSTPLSTFRSSTNSSEVMENDTTTQRTENENAENKTSEPLSTTPSKSIESEASTTENWLTSTPVPNLAGNESLSTSTEPLSISTATSSLENLVDLSTLPNAEGGFNNSYIDVEFVNRSAQGVPVYSVNVKRNALVQMNFNGGDCC